MEELGIRPSVAIVSMVGKVFQELGMLDKYKKLHRKYQQPKWEYRYIRGKRVKIQAKDLHDGYADQGVSNNEEVGSNEPLESTESSSNGDGVEPEEIDKDSNDSEEAETNANEIGI